MAIEKGLYAAPQSIDESDESLEGGLEIEIVNPDMVTLDDGSVEVTLIPGGMGSDDDSFDANLVESLEEGVLNELADELVGLVDADIDSRKDWADTFVKGLDVLGFKYEERSEPWDGACGVYSTVLAEAAIRFQAETMSETFPSAGPVKTKVIGEETKEKEEAAARVKADMNYELTESIVPSMSAFCTVWASQGPHLRKFTLILIWIARQQSIYRLKMLSFPMVLLILRAQSVLRTLCVRPRTN